MKHLLYLFLALTIASCELIEAVAPVDWSYTPPAPEPIDSLLPPDTCSEYFQFNDPFITGVLQFDIIPDTIIWYYRNDPIDFNIAFPTHTLYISGHNVSLIVFGTNVYTQWQANIWAHDGSGAKNYLSFGREVYDDRQQFNFLGALTYNQMLELMPQILSARRFGFYNSGLTCEQAESLIQILADNCVDGEGKIMDLRHAPCVPNSNIMLYLTNANWQILI